MSKASPPGQFASVYRIDDRLIVHSMDRAKSGVWIGGEFVVALPSVGAGTELGAAVRKALVEARQNVPHPSDWRDAGRVVLDASGKKTWRALQKAAVLVEVRRDLSTIRVVPTRNGGTAGDDRGFHELTDRELVLRLEASSNEIAEAVLAALEACC
jgi:hypothetical protein